MVCMTWGTITKDKTCFSLHIGTWLLFKNTFENLLTCHLSLLLCFVSQQVIWQASSPSCCRTQRRCRGSQSSASGWSYLPGPSPCLDSLTTSNNTSIKAVSHHITNTSSNVMISDYLNNVSMASIVPKHWFSITGHFCTQSDTSIPTNETVSTI